MLLLVFSLVGCLWITTADEILVVTAFENDSISLNCTAHRKHGLNYWAVRWYKEGVDPRLTGLVSRSPPNGTLKWYVGADTRVALEYPSLSLMLPPVSCSDSGVYQCYLAAPVGQQNREGRVRLVVKGCPTDPPVIPEGTVEIAICAFPDLRSEPVSKDGYLVICGAVGVLLSAFVIFAVSYRSLKNALWQKTKTPGKELYPYPNPNSPPEKQDLLWIATLGPPPKKTDITAA
uniref:Ig-like domain-containing protein n=1 Tax=Neogobius melanostomus TaxID=47308 RepID=A0A8C6TAV5_9GOBI